MSRHRFSRVVYDGRGSFPSIELWVGDKRFEHIGYTSADPALKRKMDLFAKELNAAVAAHVRLGVDKALQLRT